MIAKQSLSAALLRLSLLLCLVGAGAGCDGGSAETDGGGGSDAGSMSGSDGGGPGTDGGAPATDGGGGGSDAGPAPGPAGRVIVGHLGGSAFQVRQLDTSTLAETAGSPYTAPGAYNDLAVDPARGLIALVTPGDNAVVLLDAETLTPAAGSPITTSVTPLTVAFDGEGRLFVYAADGPSMRRFFVYDLASTPTEVTGSPFTTDLVATEMVYDTDADRLIGVSTSSVWIAEVGASGITPMFGTPTSVTAGSLAIDVGRRRVYYTARFPSQLFARDLDTFEEIGGSPLSLPGDFPTSLALDPDGGDLFVLDGSPLESGQPTTLHHVTTSPLAVQDTCGAAAGCTLPESETGLAFDPLTDRLFTTIVMGSSDGAVGVWDGSSPGSPTDLMMNVTVDPVPAWLIAY